MNATPPDVCALTQVNKALVPNLKNWDESARKQVN